MKNGYLTIKKLAEGKVEGYTLGDVIDLGSGPVMIARPCVESDAMVPDIKIIGDYYISRSRTPVEIYFSPADNCFYLEDCGTKYGVFVDYKNGDQQLKLTPHNPHPLEDNIQIIIAKVPGMNQEKTERVVFEFRDSHATLDPPVKPKEDHGLFVDMMARKVFVDGIPTQKGLSRTEWKVLEVLLQEPGRVFSQDEICLAVWGHEAYDDNFTFVPKYIQRLRDKIEPDRKNPRFIVTRYNGYALELNNG